MNCLDFSKATGMRCEPLPMRDGSQAIAILTPFSFFDGDGVTVYACAKAQQVEYFDDGACLDWLRTVGLNLDDNRHRWPSIRAAVERYGVVLDEDGGLTTVAPAANPATGFARMVSAQLAIDTWARDCVGKPQSPHLLDEAALYLRAWRPTSALVVAPEASTRGITGKVHGFAFRKGNGFVDVIQPHQAASAAELRKLTDVRQLPENADLDIRVIVDDRRDPEAAAQEVQLLSSVARSWPMTRLIEAASQPIAAQ